MVDGSMLWPGSASLGRHRYLGIISAAATLRHLDQILAHSIVSSHHPDLITVTALLRRVSDLGGSAAAPHALRLFSSVEDPDIFLLNVLLRTLPHSLALPLLSSLPCRYPHLRPNSFTYATVASAAAARPESIAALHARIVVDGFANDPYVGSALADLYLNSSQVSIAEKVFDAIPEPDTVLWNTLISGLVNNCSFPSAASVFQRMMISNTAKFSSTTLAVILPAAAELQDLILGSLVHCLAIKLGFASLTHIVTGLISMYSKCGNISAAELLFREIEFPDIIAHNAMISGYSINGLVTSSVCLFKKLLALGVETPNSSTMVGLIPVFNPFGYELLITCIHGFSIKAGVVLNSAVSTSFTTIYCRVDDMESARRMFDAMPKKSIASWNAMISGYTQNGMTEMAISLFKEMQVSNVKPNQITVTSILSACAQLGSLTLGKWVHDIIIEEQIELNVFVLTALIDMYAKCGSISEARKIFDEMEEKNVVSWNAMISAYGLHGKGTEALKLFEAMLSASIVPTGVTFLSVLYACSHGGLVEKGQNIFKSMLCDYGIKPRPEHYACMVDLLGRAGRINEALEFIQTTPEASGPGVWGALLGACMIHKESKLARMAADKLFELEPENPGYYVLLSNIHSSKRNYLEAAMVRQDAKKKHLVKSPGCTSIEVGDVMHTFTANDNVHPQSAAIYSELEKITSKMAEEGYQPDTDAALYDVEEEEKEHMVKVHSEKLAITFAIISTDPGTEIRIFKNLRVCLDCHSWTKFVSKITERLIIVRDATRFHHVKDGVCSCGDYW
ncbi:pentatricopeptide repeat-containing protein At4g30700 [Curcuma longa]|uniref:pentatricopeptide repeat-containing protein At4g30700 n=1 Tax=Curcuma longa TaxID=136217 RepID=UPI003D9E7C67